MKKFLITFIISLLTISSVIADTDGENSLSKKNPGKVKDCFEKINRATFWFALCVSSYDCRWINDFICHLWRNASNHLGTNY